MIKGRNILPELDLSCSTNYGHGVKKKKKQPWATAVWLLSVKSSSTALRVGGV